MAAFGGRVGAYKGSGDFREARNRLWQLALDPAHQDSLDIYAAPSAV